MQRLPLFGQNIEKNIFFSDKEQSRMAGTPPPPWSKKIWIKEDEEDEEAEEDEKDEVDEDGEEGDYDDEDDEDD